MNHGPFYESEEGHADASFENNTLEVDVQFVRHILCHMGTV